MNRLRLWILGAALGSFAAGMNVGYAIPGVLEARAADALPDYVVEDDLYVQRMTATYELSTAQQRSLRLVLQAARDEEILAFRSVEAAQLPPALRQRLLAARGRAEQRLRALLTAAQRERYDADSRPQQNSRPPQDGRTQQNR